MLQYTMRLWYRSTYPDAQHEAHEESTMSSSELGPMPATLQPWRPAQPTFNPAVLSKVPSAASAIQAHWVLWLVFHP